MAGALAVRRVDADARVINREWVFTPSGNYAQGGAFGVPGETLNFNVGSGAGGIVATNPKGKARATPGGVFAIEDFEIAQVPGGYDAVLEPNAGATPGFTNVVLRFFTNGGAELAAGAYPAGLLNKEVMIWHTSDKKNG